MITTAGQYLHGILLDKKANIMYCNFKPTGKTFNNKKVYKCSECGLELGLDNPNTKVLCFYQDIQLKQTLMKEAEQEPQQQEAENLCSKEEIDSRLAICNTCEHYKNEACMLCGCRIVREKNYLNKLANKDASCPDGRWGPIES